MTSSNTISSTDPRAGEFEQAVHDQHLAVLWERLAQLVTRCPSGPTTAHVWHWDQVREVLLEAGRRISAAEAERRVLIMENPGMVGRSRITTSLYAGVQLVLPGEVAPAHRHSQSALRLVLEGRGGHTVVDGQRLTMTAGDLLVTPPMRWHDHGNESDGPVIWLDLLDIPLVQHLDTSFYEPAASAAQPVTDPAESVLDADDSGGGVARIRSHGSRGGPGTARFAYSTMHARLETRRRAGPPDPWHGYRIEYQDPGREAAVLRTMSAWLSLLPRGWAGRPRRTTDATIQVALSGHGITTVDGQAIPWGPCDVLVVPSWSRVEHQVDAESIRFSCSDAAAQRALGLWREDLHP